MNLLFYFLLKTILKMVEYKKFKMFVEEKKENYLSFYQK